MGPPTIVSPDPYEFDVAFSFAGRDRQCVEPVARLLAGRGLRVFYDDFEQVKLWGRDLILYLDDVYRRKARFCVVYVSRHYAASRWTSHEMRSALSRALVEDGEYILPVRLDATEVPGLRPSLGYIDLHKKKYTPEQLAALIEGKLNGEEPRVTPTSCPNRQQQIVLLLSAAFCMVLFVGHYSPALPGDQVTRAWRTPVDGEAALVPVTIRVRLTGSGAPAINRQVTIHRHGEVLGEYVSDLNGEVHCILPPGVYSLIIPSLGGAASTLVVGTTATIVAVDVLPLRS